MDEELKGSLLNVLRSIEEDSNTSQREDRHKERVGPELVLVFFVMND